MKPRLARHIMSRPVITVYEDESLAQVARTFSDHRISGAPVLNRKDRLAGVVTTADILDNELKVGHEVVSEVDFYGRPDLAARSEWKGFHLEQYADTLVRDVMTPVVISAPADATIFELSDLMGVNRIHRVLITEGERIAGVVSALDLIGLIPGPVAGAGGRREVLFPTDLGADAYPTGTRAVEIALDLDARLILLHVTPDLATLMRTYGERPELSALQQQFEEVALGRLHDLAASLLDDQVDYEVLGRSGDPAPTILDLVAERRPAYVVIGAERPAGERLAGLGSVANKVLRHSPVPVLTIPRGAAAVGAGR